MNTTLVLFILFTFSVQSIADYEIIEAKVGKIKSDMNFLCDSGESVSLYLILKLRGRGRTLSLILSKDNGGNTSSVHAEYAHNPKDTYIRIDSLDNDSHKGSLDISSACLSQERQKIFDKQVFDTPLSTQTKVELLTLIEEIQADKIPFYKSLESENFDDYRMLIGKRIGNS
jgi:hypothetical protein